MRVVVYICCDPDQRELGEQPIRLAWADNHLAPANVSMGKDENWRIAQTNTYRYPVQDTISSIEVSYVYRGEIPPTSEWQFLRYARNYPNQALEVRIADIGSNFLGWAVLPYGDVPEVNEYLINYGIKPDGTKLMRAEPWFRTAINNFHSDESNPPFAGVYLVHHQMKTVETAVPVAAKK